MRNESQIPFFLKIIFTAFVIALTPIYSYFYGWKNFLWFSNIGLFLTIPALWLESSLIISTLCITILPLEFLWNVDFFTHLLTNSSIIDDLADYMFDPALPLWLRIFSLYHVILPALWIYCLYKFRYNTKTLRYAFLGVPLIFLISYTLSSQEDNINWVCMASISEWNISEPLWTLLLIGMVLIMICIPIHLLLKQYLSVRP